MITFLKLSDPARDAKSGERGEHARAIVLPLLCYFLACVRAQDVQLCISAYFWLQLC